MANFVLYTHFTTIKKKSYNIPKTIYSSNCMVGELISLKLLRKKECKKKITLVLDYLI